VIQTILPPEISSISGKPCELRTEKIELNFRGETFEVFDQYWFDPADGSDFTTAPLSDITQRLLHSAYREKHGIPFPEEITEIRERFGMSARAMSSLLGIGTNQYSLYEKGEVPSKPIGKLIASLRAPKAFKQLLEAESEGIPEKKRLAALSKFEELKQVRNKKYYLDSFLSVKQRFDEQLPKKSNGYRKPSLHNVAATIALLSIGIDHLYTVKLNKLLFYVDQLVFSAQGKGLTGLTYCAIPMGPVPDDYRDVFSAISQEEVGALKIDRPANSFGDSGEQFEAFKASSIAIQMARSIISDPLHLKAIEQVRSEFGFMKTDALVELSHQEPEWIDKHESKGKMEYQVRGVQGK
jgi:uncharacterized phage-associated protein/DNA-binding transcriptional regulator YiaG